MSLDTFGSVNGGKVDFGKISSPKRKSAVDFAADPKNAIVDFRAKNGKLYNEQDWLRMVEINQ